MGYRASARDTQQRKVECEILVVAVLNAQLSRAIRRTGGNDEAARDV